MNYQHYTLGKPDREARKLGPSVLGGFVTSLTETLKQRKEFKPRYALIVLLWDPEKNW